MKTMSVQIVTLEPMQVVSAHGFGAQPEDMAWKKMESWAKPKGLLENPTGRRMFGYNNPSPSAGSPNYGYEFCLTVSAEEAETILPPELAAEGIRVKELSGGKYAMAPFDEPVGPAIGAAWQRLDAWVADNGYRHGRQQWLEEHTLQGRIIALLYPLA